MTLDINKIVTTTTQGLGHEFVNFERLDVSSPVLDRPLKTPEDFVRFSRAPDKFGVQHAMKKREPLGSLFSYRLVINQG
jgi:hypothetical protein